VGTLPRFIRSKLIVLVHLVLKFFFLVLHRNMCSIFAEFSKFFWKTGCGRNWQHSVPNFVHPTFFNFLKRGTKSKFFQKYPHEYRSTATQERIRAVSFHFHVTLSLEFEIFKMGAKLGTLPLIHKNSDFITDAYIPHSQG
jgi:hypothetical protein